MSSSSPVGDPIVPLILRQRYLFLLVLHSLYSFLLPTRRTPTWLHARGQLPAERPLLDPGVEQTGQGAFTVLPWVMQRWSDISPSPYLLRVSILCHPSLVYAWPKRRKEKGEKKNKNLSHIIKSKQRCILKEKKTLFLNFKNDKQNFQEFSGPQPPLGLCTECPKSFFHSLEIRWLENLKHADFKHLIFSLLFLW